MTTESMETNSQTLSERLENSKSLSDLIEDGNWPRLRTAVKEFPDKIKELDEVSLISLLISMVKY
jgi:hypothetical protein